MVVYLFQTTVNMRRIYVYFSRVLLFVYLFCHIIYFAACDASVQQTHTQL